MEKFLKLPIIFIALSTLLTGCLLSHTLKRTKETAYGVIDKTMNADNAIYNYEWFKQQYNDYLAIQKKIEEAQNAVINFEFSAGERSTWTFEDKTEHSRLNSIVDGLKYQLQDIISEYNAKSKMVNRAILKTGDLPETIQ